jgi:CRISPR-associated endonuclease Csn1
LPYPKRQKFTQKEASLDDFIQRQLNDTRYITREILKYIKQLGCTVTGSRGKVTSELRHQWGLNSILECELPGLKNREDHRHHAIDAVVTALTSQKHLRELAVTKYAVTHDGFPVPWEGFRDAVAEALIRYRFRSGNTEGIGAAARRNVIRADGIKRRQRAGCVCVP